MKEEKGTENGSKKSRKLKNVHDCLCVPGVRGRERVWVCVCDKVKERQRVCVCVCVCVEVGV